MRSEKFSIQSRIRSFYFAGVGLAAFLRSEHNARIHLAATILVTIMGFALKISRIEAIALVGAIGLVWVTEMLNTCLERTADLITLEEHPDIRFIKDLAAAAVLVAAIAAVITGAFIFIPKFL